MVISKLYGMFCLFAVCTTTSSYFVVVARSSRRLSWTHVMGFDALKALILMVRRKQNRCVSTNPTDPVSNTRLCFFLSVKMQNKKVKHRPSTKYPYFRKIAGSTLFFSGEREREREREKSFSYLPIIFFSAC